MHFQTPHLDKLQATFSNEKLPESDRARVQYAIDQYHSYTEALEKCYAIDGSENIVSAMTDCLNRYKRSIEVDLIFDSENDFLYRQKGQLKLDNSIIEEFLPRLMHHTIIPEIKDKNLGLSAGPITTFSSIYFVSSLDRQQPDAGIHIRTKDQDFAIAKKVFIKASHDSDFNISSVKETAVAYFVSEIKTNLDKTMFQEACATAHDVKASVSGAKYFLICEWLDMLPISTAPTDIDEVIILRKAKRLGSNIRKDFYSKANRSKRRSEYLKFLDANPISLEMIQRFVSHVKKFVFNDTPLLENSILYKGFF